jgi:hypothetical protein
LMRKIFEYAFDAFIFLSVVKILIVPLLIQIWNDLKGFRR